MYYGYLKTKLGILKIVTSDNTLQYISIVSMEGEGKYCKFLLHCMRELEEYFLGYRKTFTLSIAFSGTEFQKAVWSALLQISYGNTMTYSEVARMIGRPNSVRAVGNAIHNNPIMIVIPCHRVLPKSGGIGGFAYGSLIKEQLLLFEQEHRDDLVT